MVRVKNYNNSHLMIENFSEHKSRILAGIDRSVKGSIDRGAIPIVDFLNNLDEFVTTSRYSFKISAKMQLISIAALEGYLFSRIH